MKILHQEHSGKIKKIFGKMQKLFVIMRLRIILLIFMLLTAKWDNVMNFMAGAYPIHGPYKECKKSQRY